jgi:hypothetical protein
LLEMLASDLTRDVVQEAMDRTASVA